MQCNRCVNRKMPIAAAVQILLMGFWLYTLWGTDAYYSVYVLCAAAGAVCAVRNDACFFAGSWKKSFLLILFAGWFAVTTVLANYSLFIVKPLLERLLCAGGALVGGTLVAYNVVLLVSVKMPFSVRQQDGKLTPEKFFTLSFCLMEGLFLIYLLGAAYPAYFTPDVFDSLEQIVEGVYVNDNPFWYTMSIKLITGVGYLLLGSVNGSMAFYVFCQGIFMSAVFSYVLVTLYQVGVPKWAIAAVGAVYGLLPYNIAYSATMLKDIPFSVSSLLFVVSLYRIIRKVGKNQTLNYIFFAIGAFVFCLMRTNGLASFFVTVLVLLPLLQKSQKRTLVILVVAILVLTWVLTSPVLEIWNVKSTDFVEGLAVPFQQIARVITMGYELDAYEYELLDRVFDVELIPEVFMHESVDPIKRAAFREDGRVYLKENMGEYVRLWLQMGRKYPGEYLKAWIELTKGYWNGGYEYWVYSIGGEHPGLGIVRPDALPLQGFFDGYFSFVEDRVLTEPLYSIGLHVWLLFGCLVLNIGHKRTELVLSIPGIVIILGLWLGTPVYSEFRYAYPMILSIPLVLCTTVYYSDKTNTE